ncbi:hypothetical protein HZH66_012357 [Vespula vulgaris]|uniref:Uncharacterized protein n=1 Tax=Vespula vulgaris TaxID=7454 RepID=A0A834MSW1_VESVU|nr:hypothetical protein HZH66_012357 [Vespula vulgaris]
MDTLESNCKHKRAHSPFLLRSTGPVASPYAIATIVQGAFARTPYGLVVAHAAGTEQRRFIALPVAAVAAAATATAVATTIPLYGLCQALIENRMSILYGRYGSAKRSP